MITSENEKPIFRHWKHEHIFESDEMQTRVIDNIQFELPLRVIGRIFRQYAKAKRAICSTIGQAPQNDSWNKNDTSKPIFRSFFVMKLRRDNGLGRISEEKLFFYF